MIWAHTRRSEKDYRAAPLAIQRAFDKQVRLLAERLTQGWVAWADHCRLLKPTLESV